MNKNWIIGLVILFGSLLVVTALQVQVIYNPFTQKLDYIRSTNWTDDANVTFGNVTLEGNLDMRGNNITNVDYINNVSLHNITKTTNKAIWHIRFV